MSLVSSSFALIIAQHLVTSSKRKMRWPVSNQSLLSSARFLFSSNLSEASVIKYVKTYISRPLDHTLAPPAPVVSWIRIGEEQLKALHLSVGIEHKERKWGNLVCCARALSCLVLALAHARDLKACEQLPFNGSYVPELLGYSSFAISLEDWTAIEVINVNEDTWLNVVSLLITGHRFGADDYDKFENIGQDKSQPIFRDTCLVSDRGWSLYIRTFSTIEPFLMDIEHIRISKGVPCRNGVCKHEIIDGPSQSIIPETADWMVVDGAGDTALLSRSRRVHFQPSLCGDREDTFIVTVRLTDRVGTHTSIRRTGYREFYWSLCNVNRTKRCKHPSKQFDKVFLSPGCSTVEGFRDGSEHDGKITICLTSGNRVARWRAVIATASDPPQNARICLRGRDCCYACAIDLVAQEPGKWFLIL